MVVDLKNVPYKNAVSLRCEFDSKQLSPIHGHFGGLYDESGSYIIGSSLYRMGSIPVVYGHSKPFESEEARLTGRSLFAGPLFNHFGHFMLESLSRLWDVDSGSYDHIVFQSPEDRDGTFSDYQQCILEQIDALEKVVVISRPTRFDEIFVPTPSLMIGAYANPEYAAIFDRLRVRHRQIESCGELRIYLSRTKLDRGKTVGEQSMQAAFVACGYQVVYPEEISFNEQINLFSAASHVAGIQGSAFHNAVFCRPGTKTIMIVRENYSMVDFKNIDICQSLNPIYIYDVMEDFEEFPPTHAQGPYCLNLDKLREKFSEQGLCEVASNLKGPSSTALKDEFACEWHRVRS
ncbi:glycosyltransferase family 61 protein [Methylorubrum thiocyanatum]|uniref:glycosyltransferase family 61 protein n=1 Tax=Methylorubrum thiocyanatum TaxID=47958 RepID=UPI003F7D45F0